MTVQPNKEAPHLTFPVLGPPEAAWDLKAAAPEKFSLIIFYRGVHCPVCRSYLKKFDSMFTLFRDLGVELVAISMDDQAAAERARNEWGLEHLPIGYGMSEDTARDWGLFISESISDSEPRRFSEPGLFLIRPDRKIHYVAINSMSFGRPEPETIKEAIEFIEKEDYPARGRVAA